MRRKQFHFAKVSPSHPLEHHLQVGLLLQEVLLLLLGLLDDLRGLLLQREQLLLQSKTKEQTKTEL